MDTMTVNTSRLTSRCLRAGTDGPAVVLIAGLADDALSWEMQLDGLSADHQVYAIENRGAGETRAPAGPITVEDMAADAMAVCDELGLERFHLVGNSMGGAIAQEIALRSGDRLASLALCGTWATSDALMREVISSWKAIARQVDRRTFLRSLFSWCLSPVTYANEDVELWLDGMAKDTDGQTVDEFVRQSDAVLAFDSAARIPGRITCPTLVLYGTDDILVGPRHSRLLSDLLPAASQVAVPEAGHAPYLEQPRAFNEALTAFWASTMSDSISRPAS